MVRPAREATHDMRLVREGFVKQGHAEPKGELDQMDRMRRRSSTRQHDSGRGEQADDRRESAHEDQESRR
jgi:hypothetical protein